MKRLLEKHFAYIPELDNGGYWEKVTVNVDEFIKDLDSLLQSEREKCAKIAKISRHRRRNKE